MKQKLHRRRAKRRKRRAIVKKRMSIVSKLKAKGDAIQRKAEPNAGLLRMTSTLDPRRSLEVARNEEEKRSKQAQLYERDRDSRLRKGKGISGSDELNSEMDEDILHQ